MSDILPDGTVAKNDKEYVDTWRAFAEPLKQIFGASLYAFDPDLTFHKDHRLYDVDNAIITAINAKLTHYKAVVEAAREYFMAEIDGGAGDPRHRGACDPDDGCDCGLDNMYDALTVMEAHDAD